MNFIKHLRKLFLLSVAVILLVTVFPFIPKQNIVKADTSILVVRPKTLTLSIGQEFDMNALCLGSSNITWKSSDTSVASVDSYGTITAKKAGNCKIIAKSGSAEKYCRLTVAKSEIILTKTSVALECDKSYQLDARLSTGRELTYKSDKTSIATVDEEGLVTALKPGTCHIKITGDGVSRSFTIKVNKPTLRLNLSKSTMYRGQELVLKATVSNGRSVEWKSSSASVAMVDESGKVTALKHGQATITATVDGVSKSCRITVKKPSITLSKSSLTLSPGETAKITASVSSGNHPEFSSSNINLATVTDEGLITARQAGKVYIYAEDDGTKVSCIVTIRDTSSSEK